MKAETFFDAVGMIDDEMILIAKRKATHKHRSLIKPLTVIAASFAILTFPLPAAAAMGSDAAYRLLYSFSPSIAQTLKPVMRSCTDNGIKLEVVSAHIDGSRARIFLSVKDLELDRIDETVDLFDSYSINCPYDSVSHCSFSEYDESTSTAFFLVEIERLDGKNIENSKITFKVREMLFGKETFSGVLDIDTANISTSPHTTQSIRFRGASGKCDLPEYTDYRYLIPNNTLSYSPADGVTVTGIGFIDGALHIQTYYEDILHTDNHGYINLIDKLGNMIEPYSYYDEVNISFWDSENKGCYDEKIIKMPYDEVGEYRLYGEFVTSKGYVSGDWEITFPVK